MAKDNELWKSQHDKVEKGPGFLAALDQSGGSTPKALRLYGVEDDQYSGEAQMFDLIHEMRSRIIASANFDGDRILGAILFEMTMDREVDGTPTAQYLWQRKNIVPFLKVDKGLADEAHGVAVMKPMPGLNELLPRALDQGVFGTKMRSVVKTANKAGIAAILDQQFEVGQQIVDAGLMPILEPEVDIHSTDKEAAEEMLRTGILQRLDHVADGDQLMFKLTIPSVDDSYADLIAHPKVLRVVALSGGYSREKANKRLARNPGLIASFSRALTEGLSRGQSEDEFDATLDKAIAEIFAASST